MCMHGCSLPASKTSIFPLERSRTSKKFACGAIKPPLAALAGMLYLDKYFRFLLQKWPRKKFVACGAQKLSEFSNRNFFQEKVEIGQYDIKVVHLLGSRPGPPGAGSMAGSTAGELIVPQLEAGSTAGSTAWSRFHSPISRFHSPMSRFHGSHNYLIFP